MFKHQYTWSNMLEITGYSANYLRSFIPQLLTPVNWGQWTDEKRLDNLAKGQMVFSKQEVRRFMNQVFAGYKYHLGVIEELRSMQHQISEIQINQVELTRMLKGFSETLYLPELAQGVNWHIDALRKKIVDRRQDDGVYRGTLIIPGLTLQMIKDSRGQWCCNRADYLNQRRVMGLQMFRKFYEGNG